MKEKMILELTLEEVSKIVAERLKKEHELIFYSTMKVCHDDEGKIYFKYEY